MGILLNVWEANKHLFPKVLKRSGADGKKVRERQTALLVSSPGSLSFAQVVFLFTDLQIKDEAFLEDISMILTTGKIYRIFQYVRHYKLYVLYWVKWYRLKKLQKSGYADF